MLQKTKHKKSVEYGSLGMFNQCFFFEKKNMLYARVGITYDKSIRSESSINKRKRYEVIMHTIRHSVSQLAIDSLMRINEGVKLYGPRPLFISLRRCYWSIID